MDKWLGLGLEYTVLPFFLFFFFFFPTFFHAKVGLHGDHMQFRVLLKTACHTNTHTLVSEPDPTTHSVCAHLCACDWI